MFTLHNPQLGSSLQFRLKINNNKWIFLLFNLNMSSCPLLRRLKEAEQFVRRQPSLNQCTMGTGKPWTAQCMVITAAMATVMLSGPSKIWSLLGTPAKWWVNSVGLKIMQQNKMKWMYVLYLEAFCAFWNVCNSQKRDFSRRKYKLKTHPALLVLLVRSSCWCWVKNYAWRMCTRHRPPTSHWKGAECLRSLSGCHLRIHPENKIASDFGFHTNINYTVGRWSEISGLCRPREKLFIEDFKYLPETCLLMMRSFHLLWSPEFLCLFWLASRLSSRWCLQGGNFPRTRTGRKSHPLLGLSGPLDWRKHSPNLECKDKIKDSQ